MLKLLRKNSVKPASCVATVGNFDGIHIGHQAILSRLKSLSAEFKVPSLVILFEPTPMEYFKGEVAPIRLMSFQEKLASLRDFSIDYVLVLRFNKTLAKTPADVFIDEYLVKQLNVVYLVIGNDFRFGAKSLGNYELLLQKAKDNNYQVERNLAVEKKGHRVSSTLVRQMLLQKNLEQCKQYLGKNFFYYGTVIAGLQLGRKLQFPTLNLLVKRKRLPIQGVFAVIVELYDKGRVLTLRGACNIGIKPTVHGVKSSIEVHCLDWDYGWWAPKKMKVSLLKLIREEKKFDSLDDLKKRIASDVKECETFFNN